jgi:hypothetical protein
MAELLSRMDAAVKAAPWLNPCYYRVEEIGRKVSKGGKGEKRYEQRGEGKEKIEYLYPPATILAEGHFEFARINKFFISVMAAWVVPSGRRLSRTSAVYLPPTP